MPRSEVFNENSVSPLTTALQVDSAFSNPSRQPPEGLTTTVAYDRRRSPFPYL
jgi:hypothetical protein